MKSGDVPYFLRIRGCINCRVSKEHKEKTGYDYGFDHELVGACIVQGCFDYGHDLTNPYFDPAEIVRVANKVGTQKAMENARKLCGALDQQYGQFYKTEGISVSSILENLGVKSE